MKPSNIYDEAAKRFVVDLEEGRVFWGKRPRTDFTSAGRFEAWHRMFSGKEVGYRNGTRGGKGVHFMGHNVTLARLLARKKFGRKADDYFVGFKDGDSTNLRGANLYLMSAAERGYKARAPKESGLPTGVTLRDGKFEAYRRIDGKLQYLGRFATCEEADEAYKKSRPRRRAK